MLRLAIHLTRDVTENVINCFVSINYVSNKDKAKSRPVSESITREKVKAVS